MAMTDEEKREFAIDHYPGHISMYANMLEMMDITKEGVFLERDNDGLWHESYGGDSLLELIIERAAELQEAIAYRRMFGSSSLKS